MAIPAATQAPLVEEDPKSLSVRVCLSYEAYPYSCICDATLIVVVGFVGTVSIVVVNGTG